MGCIDVCVQNCMNIPINLSLCFSVSLEDTVSLRTESINLLNSGAKVGLFRTS